MNVEREAQDQTQLLQVAMMLRIGLGLVFVIGGLSKLGQLLSSASHDAMVANYMGTTGYINALFQEYLFTGALGQLITPSGFLTTLSAFELLSGIALIVGFLVRPLSLLYGFLLWSFVIALPTMTVPGVAFEAETYTSPAIFVQIRDIALSGMMFVLLNLGAGRLSVDELRVPNEPMGNPQCLALLLRFSLALPFVVGGFFGGFADIATFATTPWILAVVSLLLLLGSNATVRIASGVVIGIMAWYLVQKFSLDKSIVANLNGIKRELALIGCGAGLIILGGGDRFTLVDVFRRSWTYVGAYFGFGRNGKTATL